MGPCCCKKKPEKKYDERLIEEQKQKPDIGGPLNPPPIQPPQNNDLCWKCQKNATIDALQLECSNKHKLCFEHSMMKIKIQLKSTELMEMKNCTFSGCHGIIEENQIYEFFNQLPIDEQKPSPEKVQTNNPNIPQRQNIDELFIPALNLKENQIPFKQTLTNEKSNDLSISKQLENSQSQEMNKLEISKNQGQLIKKSKCFICLEETCLEEKGLRCGKQHYMCNPCSNKQIKDQLQRPQESMPIKCIEPSCKSHIPDQWIENCLDSKLLEEYRLINMQYCAQKFVGESEEVQFCTFCRQPEIRAKGSCKWFICQNPQCNPPCGKAYCLICEESFKAQEFYDENSPEFLTMMLHMEHMKLAPLKALQDQAMKKSTEMGCPGCGISGMKDDECLHMTCRKCCCKWCYFCGIEVKEKEFCEHNSDWINNNKHCPAMFEDLDNLFPEWQGQMKEDLHYLKKFHEIRKIMFLQEFFKKIKEEEWQLLVQNFKRIQEEKINTKEIKETNSKETKFFFARWANGVKWNKLEE